MVVYAAIFLSFLNGICVRGAKMLVSLSALDYGASSFEVGLIGATFPVFQLLLAVYAGRISDRIGVRVPLIAGSLTIAASTAIPLAWPGIPGLVVAGLAIGCGMIFFQVSMHNLIGSYGTGDARTRNFATFSLGQSTSAFFGPSITGFSIDGWGYRATFALLALVALVPAAIMLAIPAIVPRQAASAHKEKGGARELLAIPGLRRTLIMSGVTLTGVELFSFYFPVYGRAVGLSASAIGMVMSSYALAAFIVRMGMHRASRAIGEIGVLTASLLVAGATFFLVPLFSQAPLLAAVAFLLGLGLGCAQPLTILLTYNHAPAGRSGEALGMRLTVNKLIQIAVPLLFGGLGTAFGLLPVFWANGAFLLLGGAVSLAERKVSAQKATAAAAPVTPRREENTA
ncbi:MAG TPA: MFS transporter [Usitatibacter sp.]|nr:MFS transporter [Usitatibacter sp.]